ncbi:MAG: tetratricopeptide repeat protein [Rubrobacteraceae bacterium]
MSKEQNPSQRIKGNYNAQAFGGSVAKVNVSLSYEHIPPRQVNPEESEEGQLLLESLPLDHVPEVGPLHPGSVGSPMDLNPLLVGRKEDLKELAERIRAEASGSVTTVCIYGIGGVGKTQLASEFAHHYGQFFRGGVYWLNVSNPGAIAEEIARCGGAGAMDLRGDFDRLSLEDQVSRVKSEWQNELPRLLVLDNCEDPGSLRACRPTMGEARVLLTSRGPFTGPALAVVSVELQVLDSQHSLELLQSRCQGVQMEEDDLVAIAEELGDLPLALDLAGRFLFEYRDIVSASEYVEELQSVEPLKHRSLQQSDGYSPTSHELDVGRTFIVSYERLDQDETTDRLAIRLLARAAYFAPGEQIERALLLSTLERAGDSEEDPNEMPDPYQQADALRRLTDLGLISAPDALEGGTGGGQLRIHRLIASFVRLEVDDGEAKADVERVTADRATDVAREEAPVRLTALLPHLRYITEAAADRDDKRAYKLRFALGASLMKLEAYAEAVPLLESAVKYGAEHYGATDWIIMRQRNDLGIALNRAGKDDEALKVYEEVLEDQKRELGLDDPDVASTLNNIGALLRDKGRLDEVRDIYERALEIRKNAFGWNHSDTAESFANMAALMIDLEKYEDAWSYLQEALEIYEKVKGPEHLDSAGPLWMMGSLLRREEKFAEAQPLFERVLKIRETALGQENRYVFESLDELGSVLALQGAFEKAQPCFERALELSQRLYGENHPDTAMILDKLASVLAEQQKYDEAQPLFERELAISEEIMGPDHSQTRYG